MDQVKEILRQIAKYRFWISVCVAALLSVGAYVMGSGPVKSETEAQIGKISSAAKDVQQYSSPATPTRAFQPVVEEKTASLTKDVDKAWKELYDRQAPLLTWPETVAERFKKWGRSWPEDEAAGAVQLAIVDYVEAYPEYVESVYKTFHPFDYETGEGIVAAPPASVLLRPAGFDINRPPGMGKVWSAQERLWTQRTVLEVVAEVNRDATDWDSAYIKEIKALEVGNYLSQDQRSVAKGEELEEAEDILAPGEEALDDEEMGGDPAMGGMMMPGGMGSGGGRREMGGYGSGGMMGSGMMPGMMGSGMGGGMGFRGEAESVLFLKPENATQYKILPIMLTVLIDQDHIQNLLVELENSPMIIEVRDIEWLRPTERVVKPEKGAGFTGYGGMMGSGMMPGMMGPGMMGGRRMGEMDPSMMMGPGGPGMLMGPGMMGGRRMGEMDPSMMMGPGGGPGMMMGPGMGMGTAQQRQGVDKRGVNRAEKRQEEAKAREAALPTTNFDAYYNIVQVTVYGQARFFNEPTPEAEESATSLGETDDAEAGETTPEEAPAAGAEAAAEDQVPAEAEAPAEAQEAAPEAPAQPEAQAPADAPEAEPAEAPEGEAEAPADADAEPDEAAETPQP